MAAQGHLNFASINARLEHEQCWEQSGLLTDRSPASSSGLELPAVSPGGIHPSNSLPESLSKNCRLFRSDGGKKRRLMTESTAFLPGSKAPVISATNALETVPWRIHDRKRPHAQQGDEDWITPTLSTLHRSSARSQMTPNNGPTQAQAVSY